MNNFQHNLKMLSMRAGVTQYRIAKDLDINAQTYRNIEYGQQKPNIDHLIKLSQYFSISIDDLILSKQ